MPLAAEIMNNIVPVSDFSRGKASRAFAKVAGGVPVIVVKNNAPTAVITSPEEYARLTAIEEDYLLLNEAFDRLSKNEGRPAVPLEEVLSRHGITQADLSAADEVEFD